MLQDRAMTRARTGAKSIDPDRTDPDPDQAEKAAGAADKRRKLDNLLDEALEATFPASDPVSVTQPVAQRHHRQAA
jgi:hypothetical protein